MGLDNTMNAPVLEPMTFRHSTWDWSRPYVVGVLNVTPDSFSDGGRYRGRDAALARARELVAAGADCIDVGGESTRPGAKPVTEAEELERVLPVVEALSAELAVPLSIDTYKSAVARAAVAAGAELVNDVSGGAWDGCHEVARDADAVFVCGHLVGRDVADVHAPDNRSSVEDVIESLRDRCQALAGVRTIVDPGLGFGKAHQVNLELCKRAGELSMALQYAVMVGPSRKRFVAAASGVSEPGDAVRDAATIGACLAAVAGGAQVLRVHNVAALVPALRLFQAVSAS